MRMTVRSITALAISLALAACGKDSGTGPSGGGGNSLTATVDGGSFKASSITVGASHVQNILSVQGTEPSAGIAGTRTISLTVMGVTGPGTYSLTSNGSVGQYVVLTSTGSNGWVSSLVGGSGTLEVTQLDSKNVKGTFSFTGLPASEGVQGNKTVTNGKFSASLTSF